MISIPKFFKQDPEIGEKMELPLLPLRDVVIFPQMVSPLFVGREQSISALAHAMGKDKMIFLATQNDSTVDNPERKDLSDVGSICTVLQLLKLPDGTVKALVEGKRRARIAQYVSEETFVRVVLEEESEGELSDAESQALSRAIIEAFKDYAESNKKISKDIVSKIADVSDPSELTDKVAACITFKISDKQKLLETFNIFDRMQLLIQNLKNEIEIFNVEKSIHGRVKTQMEKTQKNYYLNEQIRAIKKEMGTEEGGSDDMEELAKRIQDKKLSIEAQEKAEHEFKKLKMMSPMSSEAAVVRNYIDWILDLPWFESSIVESDLDKAEKILNEDHYGLKKPKERILEYLAVEMLVKKMKGPILCLVGPPGVGKTSIAKSVARATDRKFIRLSLGGVRDEAEIRGHRRTYVGAMPGKVIQSLKKSGVNNPVFCLDEVDKMSMDFRGDPSSALLEVLDPEQNSTFNDHYLDMDYDLSEILFITTANYLQDIPLPLKDRMEIIQLSGYTEYEKCFIAQDFLLPKQIEANGLSGKNVEFTKQAILKIIENYTKESGVRNLEREIASVCRKIARRVVKEDDDQKFKVTQKSLLKYLDQPKFKHGLKEKKNQIGLVTGLAWTQVGGELLYIETVLMPGKGELIVTGNLGDVMKESIRAAVSYVRSRSEELSIEVDFYKKYDIHVHVPEGATPKDGPSAGITICTSIVSALAKKFADRNIAMTGEITLRGRVLPIGGLKEKILAAHRGGITKVLIPEENEKDITEIPKNILKQLEIIPVENMDQVLKEALLVNGDEKVSA